MNALDGFDEALRGMKQAVLDLRGRCVCRPEDVSGATAALAMLEMVGRRVRCEVSRGPVSASTGADWRERQLPAGDR
ncbi:hypothetical protein [Desulfocurvus sp. DL9XJH121]